MFNLVIGFLNDFLIIAGGMITAGMLAQDQIAVPRSAVVLLACLTGLVQAARRLQSKIDPSPTKPTPVEVATVARIKTMRSVAELEAEGKAKEDAALLAGEAERVMAIVRREILAAQKGAAPAPVASAPAVEQKAVPKDSS